MIALFLPKTRFLVKIAANLTATALNMPERTLNAKLLKQFTFL